MDYFPEEGAGVRGSRSTPDVRRSFEGQRTVRKPAAIERRRIEE
jgi:hypothetical protein